MVSFAGLVQVQVCKLDLCRIFLQTCFQNILDVLLICGMQDESLSGVAGHMDMLL